MTGESDPALRYYRSEPILMEFLRVNYSRFIGCHQVKPLDAENMAKIRRLSQCIESTSSSEEESERFFNCCKLSFDSMVSQTEYQDAKAVRILTIMTFLSVIAVLMFKVGLDGEQFGIGGFKEITFLCLISYILLTLFGVVFTLHAIQTRFNHLEDTSKLPRSLTFFKTVSSYAPAEFVHQFGGKERVLGGPTIPPIGSVELLHRMSQDFIAESYLISGKIVKKVGILKVGTMFFKISLIPILVWIVILLYYYFSDSFESFFK